MKIAPEIIKAEHRSRPGNCRRQQNSAYSNFFEHEIKFLKPR